MKSERHDYVLEIKVQNLGNEKIHSYHVDLEFPARVIEKSKATAFLVEDRTNRVSCFFRSIRHGQDDVIFPGDTKEVMSFPYYMDDGIYSNSSELFKQSVKATFYRDGFQPLTIKKPFGELQFF